MHVQGSGAVGAAIVPIGPELVSFVVGVGRGCGHLPENLATVSQIERVHDPPERTALLELHLPARQAQVFLQNRNIKICSENESFFLELGPLEYYMRLSVSCFSSFLRY